MTEFILDHTYAALGLSAGDVLTLADEAGWRDDGLYLTIWDNKEWAPNPVRANTTTKRGKPRKIVLMNFGGEYWTRGGRDEKGYEPWRILKVESPKNGHTLGADFRPPRRYEQGKTVTVEREVMTRSPDPDSCYAVRIDGNCLEPVFSHGQAIICCPASEPRPGDFVVLWVKNGEPKCKRLMTLIPPHFGPGSEVAGALKLEQLNPHQCYFVPTDILNAVHKVLGPADESDIA